MRYTTLLFCFITLALARPCILNAQNTKTKQATLKISGAVSTPMVFKMTDLKQFEQTDVVHKEKDGKDHTYTGVLLSALLEKAGVAVSKEHKAKNLTKYVLCSASDGYQVTFAMAELDKDFTDRKIIVATLSDGKPLPDTEGPFRIIVPDEKKPARCMKQVAGIKVAFAK